MSEQPHKFRRVACAPRDALLHAGVVDDARIIAGADVGCADANADNRALGSADASCRNADNRSADASCRNADNDASASCRNADTDNSEGPVCQ